MRGEIISRGVNLELSNLKKINYFYVYKFKKDIENKKGEKIICINGINPIKKAIITGEFEFSEKGELKKGYYGHLHIPVTHTQTFDKYSNKWEENFDKFIYINHNLFRDSHVHFRFKDSTDILWSTGYEKNIYNPFSQNVTKIYLGDNLVNKIQQEF